MPSSSLILSVGTILSALSSTAVATRYQQEESFTGRNWLNAFQFKTDDFNNGFVNYVDQATAMSRGLYTTSGDDVVFGVDSTETLNYKSGPGRKSVRLEGTKNYNKGLFILDVKRMPGVCGMWPAFWSLGQEPWPVKGEIDIIEGVNDNTVNKYVLHTDTTCKVNGLGQSNPALGKDCAYDTAGSAGCDVNEVRTNSFGAAFNKQQGGYYVMEWDSDAIRTWFFPRGNNIPRSLTSSNPDTSEFGTPAANFQGDCNIDQRFKDQRFIFTNNFCGDWAGNVYGNSNCPKQFDDTTHEPLNSMESCKKYVANNPHAFAGQYWQIGSFRTFSKKAIVSSSSVALSRSSSMASSSARVSSSPIHASSTPASSSVSHASSTPVSSSPVHASSTPASSSPVHASSTPAGSSISHASNTPVSSSPIHALSTPASSSPHAISSSAASSSAAASSPVHIKIVSHASSDAHSASSASSEMHSSSSVAYGSSSSNILEPSGKYPTPSSSAVYPSFSGSAYSASSSSIASVHYNDYSGTSAVYSAPAYSGSASAPVYGSSAPSSTPCTTSSAMGASSTPVYSVYPSSAPSYGEYPSSASKYGDYPSYPVSSPVKNSYPKSADNYNNYPSYPVSSPVGKAYHNSASAYGDYPSYPASSPVKNDYPSYPASSSVKNDYPYLPSFTPVSPISPPPTTTPTYDSYPVSKSTITTTYTTTYIDICATGYTTKTTTFAVTYCPTSTPTVPTPGKPTPGMPTYGWDVTTKICEKGCGESKKTVTLTVPCTQCDYAAKTTPTTPAMVSQKPACNGSDCAKEPSTSTSKVYETKIVTLTKSPVPASPSSAKPMPPSSSPVGYGGEKPMPSKPVEVVKSVPAMSEYPVVSMGGYPGLPASSPVVGKPAGPTGKWGGANGTMSVAVGTVVYGTPTPSKTGYSPPMFTGAASSVRISGFVAAAVGVVAVFL